MILRNNISILDLIIGIILLLKNKWEWYIVKRKKNIVKAILIKRGWLFLWKSRTKRDENL